MLVCLAFAQEKCGEAAAACASLRKARTLAAQFDAAPDYRAEALRFVSGGEPAGVYDDLGATALAGVRKTVTDMGDAGFLELWRQIDEQAP